MKKALSVFLGAAMVLFGCQKQEDPTLSVSRDKVDVAATGQTVKIGVKSNTDWTAKSDQAWAAVAPSSGSKDGDITINVEANDVAKERTATVTVEASGLSKQITLKQAAKETPIAVNGQYKYETIGEAVDAAPAGATIMIKGGTFKENIKIPAGKDVKIQLSPLGKAGDVIIEGGLEIAGKAELTNLVLKSAGNDGVVLLDCKAGSDVKATNCKFNAKGGKCHCSAVDAKNLVLESDIFEEVGAHTYAIYLDKGTKATLKNNTFKTEIGIYVEKTFSGSLTLGEKTEDSNTFGSEVKKALSGDKDKILANGATLSPKGIVFDQTIPFIPPLRLKVMKTFKDLKIAESKMLTMTERTYMSSRLEVLTRVTVQL